MKNGCKYLLVLILFSSISFFSFASKLEDRMKKIIYEKELDFKNVPLSDVLSVISKTSGISVVAEGTVATTDIDLYFGRGQSMDDIIKTIKTTHNLNSRELNNVLILGKTIKNVEDEKGKITGKIISARTGEGLSNVKVYIVGHEDEMVRSEVGGNFILEDIEPGTYIIKAESDMYDGTGEIIEVQEGKTISQNLKMRNGHSMDMQEIEETQGIRLLKNTSNLGSVINSDGDKEITERIRLRHTIPTEIKTVIDSVVPDVNVTAVENQHLLVIRGTDENIDIVKKLVDELDVPVKQVRITAQILEVSGNLTEELGIDWSFDGRDGATIEAGKEGLFSSVVSGLGKITFTDYLSGASDIIDATLNILQETSDANLAAIPSIVTLNGETAEISVSTEQNVGTTERTDDAGNTIREPTFKEAGTVLSITPLIRDGDGEADMITLVINTELSSFVKESVTGSDQFLGASQKNIASTRVRVEDGGVIFIGGLQRTETTNTVDKVPFLGDIPFLGRLFRRDEVSTKKKDIYIQIKAEIVTEENRNNDISTEGFRVEEVNLNQKLF
jgi:general secretion pathway protein D